MQSISYVPQRKEWDCGIASLAMITGLPYEVIWADLEVSITQEKGINDLHVHDWALRNGWAVQIAWQNHPVNGRYIKRDPWPPAPFAPTHLVQASVPAGAHFLAMDANGEIFDPWKADRKTLSHPDYLQIHWVMGFWPVRPSP